MNQNMLNNHFLSTAKPDVTVVLPAFNASPYIDEAIRSILNQTLKNFELIIINDGSTDDTLQKIHQYQDNRIVVINQTNTGLVESLNRGIALARADLIARQDADDASLPQRLEIQYQMFAQQPDLALLGSSMVTIDENSLALNHHHVLIGNPEIRQELLVRSPFAHGSVMFRKETFSRAGGYRTDDWPAEDYGLWVRMSAYGRFANIDEPLYRYRDNSTGISATHQALQQQKAQTHRNRAWTLRRKLTPVSISIARYVSLNAGEERISRIFDNILYSGKRSLRPFDAAFIFRNAFLLIQSPHLLNRSIKILFGKLRTLYA